MWFLWVREVCGPYILLYTRRHENYKPWRPLAPDYMLASQLTVQGETEHFLAKDLLLHGVSSPMPEYSLLQVAVHADFAQHCGPTTCNLCRLVSRGFRAAGKDNHGERASWAYTLLSIRNLLEQCSPTSFCNAHAQLSFTIMLLQIQIERFTIFNALA